MNFGSWEAWLILGIILAIAEIVVPGFVLACFAIGAFASSLTTLITDNLAIQLASFSIGTFLSFISVRPFFTKMSKTTVKTNIDAYTGLTGLVVETIDPSTGQGRISIGGESWKARTEDNSKLEEEIGRAHV